MTETSVLPQRNFWRPVLITTAIFLAIGLTAGGAMWYMKKQNAPVVLTSAEKQDVEQRIEEAQYEPGINSIVLTQREVNGLINAHTTFGKDLKIELAKGTLHARINTTLDQNVPVLGGKTVKARARFLVDANELNPSVILDDLTVYGVSVPNAWLGELKGQNLLASLSGSVGDNAFSRGIEDIKIENGLIDIQLAQ
ncbi:hypothetical protein N9055_01795 [Akkermansiaceae bacterium]|nr:hypothetical protein [Akkermansiaceae bacterium]